MRGTHVIIGGGGYKNAEIAHTAIFCMQNEIFFFVFVTANAK